MFRLRIFIDFWNLSLGARDLWGRDYRINYRQLPTILMGQVSADFGIETSHEGTYVYAGVDLSRELDKKLNRFLLDTVDAFPGYKVRVFNRKPRHPPTCPSCHETIAKCPHCGSDVKGTMEKGVDVSIVTDMLQHTWDDTYDIAILLSNDADFIPAVDFLNTRGKKIIHAGFGHQGADLAKSAWGHIGLDRLRTELDHASAT